MFLSSVAVLAFIAVINFSIISTSRIEIIKAKNFVINKQKINETNLYDYLHRHEKQLLFGNDMSNSKYKIINVKHHRRTKRDLTEIEEGVDSTINIKISDSNDDNFQLKLKRSENLIDDSFVFISRNDNNSNFVDSSFDVISKYSNCFYRNENSAFDLCDHEIRGLYRMNDTDIFIQPLPERFGSGSHILIEKSINNSMFEPRDNFIKPESVRELVKKRVKRNSIVKIPQNKLFQAPILQKTPPDILHVETAIFVDKDLYRHMIKNFPKNTEQHLIRFILAMINGVQLLYHHPSLGYKINFILKRIEILHNEMSDLRRSSDIDIYLNSFCLWQRKLNPVSDKDVLHFDHAVILTGLDLYVVSKNGKVSSQVVGLAPVSGMCTQVSSCTINEGKHFESVFVVAHEIGHNLGMRHDTLENSCDPSSFIMSPTLGSGKITWSSCSKTYLDTFLKTTQATCLFDRGNFGSNLDHAAEGILPGERFDSDQQCMLKYGKDSVRSKNQNLAEICRDLHCQRDRYTWTSHPALEGTWCGEMMWCKSGICTSKSNSISEYYPNFKQIMGSLKSSSGQDKKFSSLIQEPTLLFTNGIPYVGKSSSWSSWSGPSECESGCLYGESGRLKEGSVGLKVISRTCQDYRASKKCLGSDKKYEMCVAKQCYSIPKLTILEFANQICNRAKEFDNEMIGDGVQKPGINPEESCKVFCKTNTGVKSRSWVFPDGTACRNENSDIDEDYYCVNGRCEKFTCGNATENYFQIDMCPENLIAEDSEAKHNNLLQENVRDYKRIDDGDNNNSTTTNPTDQTEIVIDEINEPAKLVSSTSSEDIAAKLLLTTELSTSVSTTDYTLPSITTARIPTFFRNAQNYSTNYSIKRLYPTQHSTWRTRNNFPDLNPQQSQQYQINDFYSAPPVPTSMIMMRDKWRNKSGCYYSCINQAKGLQTVVSKYDFSTNVQLCEPLKVPCDKIQSTFEYSTNLCMKYSMKVRGLSGRGMQISPSIEDPDRGCRVGCQDKVINYRFYLVNGEHGFFPFGTKCSFKSHDDRRYCVNGKCLKFGADDTPMNGQLYNNFNTRSKRSLLTSPSRNRNRRHYLNYQPINMTEVINPDYLNKLISNIDFRTEHDDGDIMHEHIDLNNPIYVYSNDY
ncbi:unnamed protein product [Diamesa serratosioi]